MSPHRQPPVTISFIPSSPSAPRNSRCEPRVSFVCSPTESLTNDHRHYRDPTARRIDCRHSDLVSAANTQLRCRDLSNSNRFYRAMATYRSSLSPLKAGLRLQMGKLVFRLLTRK